MNRDVRSRTTYQRLGKKIPAGMDGHTGTPIEERKLNSCPFNMTPNLVKANYNHSPIRTPADSAAKDCSRRGGPIKIVPPLQKLLTTKKREIGRTTLHAAAEPGQILKNFRSSQIGRLHTSDAATTLADTTTRQPARSTGYSQETNLTKSFQHDRPQTPESKTQKHKPILRTFPRREVRGASGVQSADASSRGSNDEVQNKSKVRFILPGQAKVMKKKSRKGGPSLLKQENSARKGKNSVIVEQDPLAQNCPKRESVANMYKVKIGSDLAEEMEFRSLEEEDDSSPFMFGKDEVDVGDSRQQRAYSIYGHPEPFPPEECDDYFEEPGDMIETPGDAPNKHENIMSTSKWSTKPRADLKRAVELEYLNKSRHLNELVAALKVEQEVVIKAHSELCEIYKGLKRQEYDVAPCQELLVVALDKVKDYLIAGQLANSLSKEGVTDRLTEDVMYTVCVPKLKILHGEQYLDDFEKKLRHFAAKSNNTAEGISEKLNRLIRKCRGGIALSRRYCDDLLKERDASKMLCRELEEELRTYMTDIMVDMKALLKQNQLLCQLETEIRSKLAIMTLEDKTNARLKLDELQLENSRLLAELEACRCDTKRERESNDAGDNTEAGAELERLKQTLKLQEEQLTSKARVEVECREKMEMISAVTKHKLLKTARRSRKALAKGLAFKARCAALEERIADMTLRSKEDNDAHEARFNLLQEDMEAMKERLKVETSLREECEKQLDENAEYVTRSDEELRNLVKTNDIRYRHPYPRRDESPSAMERTAWLDKQRALAMLKTTRAKLARVCAERDKVLNMVSKFLVSKHIDPDDPDVPLVVMKKDTVKAFETVADDVKRLTRDLEVRTAEKDSWKKETTCLKATLKSMEGGADAASALRKNYLLEEKVQALTACLEEQMEHNESLTTVLKGKLVEVALRDRVMQEQCAAHEAHMKMIKLLDQRKAAVEAIKARGRGRPQRGAEDGDGDGEASWNGSSSSVMSLLSAVASRLWKLVGYGNPPSSSPSATSTSSA